MKLSRPEETKGSKAGAARGEGASERRCWGRRSREKQLPYTDPLPPCSAGGLGLPGLEVWTREEGAKKFPSVVCGVLLKLNQEDF